MKKNITLLFALLISISGILAQSPDLIKYQAVVHHPDGTPMANKTISMKVSLLIGSSSGTVAYSEQFVSNCQTNPYGLLNINIGSGATVTGTFSSINWSQGNLWVKLEVDTLGGMNWHLLSASQLLSVPYAKYADKAGQSSFPAGMIISFAGANIPTGWLLCDGSAISRTTYSDLFAAISITWGSGDGSTTFNLPDLRGMFLRGTGTNGTKTDAAGNYFDGGIIGNYQADKMQGHKHGPPTGLGNYMGGSPGTGSVGSTAQQFNTSSSTGVSVTDGTNGTPRIGNETKPASISVNYIIKY